MQESIELFHQIANLRHFAHTEIILFLNKLDLFVIELKKGRYLSECFDSNLNKDWNGLQWNGNDTSINYDPNKQFNNVNDQTNYFNDCKI